MNTNRSLICVALSSLLLAATSAHSQTFTDNFSGIGNGIALETSSDWQKLVGSSYLGNGSGQVRSPITDPNLTAVVSSTINWGGEDFSLSLDFASFDSNLINQTGFAWGIQDSSNYYKAWFSPSGAVAVQKFASNTDSTLYYNATAFDNSNASSREVTAIRISVDYTQSSGEHSVVFTSLAGTVTGIVGSQTLTDTTFQDGQFGVWSRFGNNLLVDDFTVTVVPEPAQASLLFGVLAIASVAFLRRRSGRK